MARKAQLKLDLIVDDKGSVVVKNFSDKTVTSLARGTKAVEGFASKLMSVNTALVALAGGYTFSKLATEALDVASSFEQMEVKLDALTKGKGAETLERINKWALDMPVNTRKAVDTFAMMQAMGLDPTIDKMQTLVDVSSIFGQETMPRVARALGQMATLGRLSAEELNQMSDAGINARKYLTEAFGVTVDELKKSQVSIEEIVDTIWKGLDADFSGAAAKAQDSWKGLTLTFQSYMEELARTTMEAGLFDAMKEGMALVNEELKEWIANNRELIAQDMATVAAGMAASFSAFASTIQFTLDTMVEFVRTWNAFVASLKFNPFTAYKDAVKAIDDFFVSLKGTNFVGIQKEWAAINKEIEKFARLDPIKDTEDLTKAFRDHVDTLRSAAGAWSDFGIEAQEVNEILNRLNEAGKDNIHMWEDFGIYANKALEETKDGITELEAVWNDAFASMGNVVDDLLVGMIEGTNDWGDLFKGIIAEATTAIGTALGTRVGGPIGGWVGGTLGKLAGAGIGKLWDSAFGSSTEYANILPASAGWTDSGFALTGDFASMGGGAFGSDVSQQMTSSVGSYLADINRRIFDAMGGMTDSQKESFVGQLQGMGWDWGSAGKSADWAASSKDPLSAIENMLNSIFSDVDSSLGGVLDGMETLGNDIMPMVSKSTEELNDQLAVLEREMIAAVTPYENFRDRVAGYAFDMNRKDWGISEYQNRLDKLVTSGDDSLGVLQEQFDVLVKILQLTEREVAQNEAIVGSLGGTINRILGGDLAPVQSAGYYGSRYAGLLSSAYGDRGSAQQLSGFAGDYLGFMQSYGGNYASIATTVATDLSNLQTFWANYDFATDTGLAITTMSTNTLLEQLITKAGEQISAIRGSYQEQQATSKYDWATDTIKSFYQTYLGRGADPGGLQHHVNLLMSGTSVEAIIGGFLGSAEYLGLQGKQHGGSVIGGQSVLVGERGPEIFTPHQSGSVVSNVAPSGQRVVIMLDTKVLASGVAKAIRGGHGDLIYQVKRVT